MAYRVSKTSALQTAVKAATDIAIAELSAGLITSHEDLMESQQTMQERFREELYEEVDRDNAAIDLDAITAPRGGGPGGGSRTPLSASEAADKTINFGKFKGLTFGQVYAMDEHEASNFTGGGYVKSGQDYLRWCAANKDAKARFAKEAAQLVLDNPPAP